MRYRFRDKSNIARIYRWYIWAACLFIIQPIYIQAASIGDKVWHDLNKNGIQELGEPGLVGIEIDLYDQSGAKLASTISDAQGVYAFDSLSSGSYYIKLGSHDDYLPTVPYHFDGNVNSDIDLVFLRSTIIKLEDSTEVDYIDIGLYMPVEEQSASIGDVVWHDLNGNGLQDPDEPGISDIRIKLFNGSKELLGIDTSDENGHYLFDELEPGYYFIQLDRSEIWNPTIINYSDDDRNSDIDRVFLKTGNILLTGGDERRNIDIGLFRMIAVKGHVWNEYDEDCLYTEGEEGIANTIVEIRDLNMNVIGSAFTEPDGSYNMPILRPGEYLLHLPEYNSADLCLSDDQLSLIDIDSTFIIKGISLLSDQVVTVDVGVLGSNECQWSVAVDEVVSSDCTGIGEISLSVDGLLPSQYTVTWSHDERTTLHINQLMPGAYTAVITSELCIKEQEVVVPGPETCNPNYESVSIDLKVLLEGAYDSNTGKMHEDLWLNGYLPGMIPATLFGQRTKAGQPYDQFPWFYLGNEGIYDNLKEEYYPHNTSDWVLVSLRYDITKESEVFRTSALLLTDGTVMLPPEIEDVVIDSNREYYVVIEHRNHLIVMSPYSVPVYNGVISFDFTTQESYRNLLGHGQKELDDNVYAMFSGNIDHDSFGISDINFGDILIFIQQNGSHSSYMISDLDFNADVNVADKKLILDNAGVFTDVPQ